MHLFSGKGVTVPRVPAPLKGRERKGERGKGKTGEKTPQ